MENSQNNLTQSTSKSTSFWAMPSMERLNNDPVKEKAAAIFGKRSCSQDGFSELVSDSKPCFDKGIAERENFEHENVDVTVDRRFDQTVHQREISGMNQENFVFRTENSFFEDVIPSCKPDDENVNLSQEISNFAKENSDLKWVDSISPARPEYCENIETFDPGVTILQSGIDGFHNLEMDSHNQHLLLTKTVSQVFEAPTCPAPVPDLKDEKEMRTIEYVTEALAFNELLIMSAGKHVIERRGSDRSSDDRTTMNASHQFLSGNQDHKPFKKPNSFRSQPCKTKLPNSDPFKIRDSASSKTHSCNSFKSNSYKSSSSFEKSSSLEKSASTTSTGVSSAYDNTVKIIKQSTDCSKNSVNSKTSKHSNTKNLNNSKCSSSHSRKLKKTQTQSSSTSENNKSHSSSKATSKDATSKDFIMNSREGGGSTADKIKTIRG